MIALARVQVRALALLPFFCLVSLVVLILGARRHPRPGWWAQHPQRLGMLPTRRRPWTRWKDDRVSSFGLRVLEAVMLLEICQNIMLRGTYHCDGMRSYPGCAMVVALKITKSVRSFRRVPLHLRQWNCARYVSDAAFSHDLMGRCGCVTRNVAASPDRCPSWPRRLHLFGLGATEAANGQGSIFHWRSSDWPSGSAAAGLPASGFHSVLVPPGAPSSLHRDFVR